MRPPGAETARKLRTVPVDQAQRPSPRLAPPVTDPARVRDGERAARIALGDQAAFAETVRAELPRIAAVARRLLGDDAEAEDVAQETLLKLWREAGRFDPSRGLLSTWLYRITTNLALDRLRARARSPITTAAADQLPEPAAPPNALSGEGANGLSARVDRALQRLPERQRLALVLCHFEGLSMAEAGGIMGISVEAVESLLARGRRSLKQDLAADWRALLDEANEDGGFLAPAGGGKDDD